MRFLLPLLAVGPMGLFACGVGHSTALDTTDASAPDGSAPEGGLPDATPPGHDAAPFPPPDPNNPSACSGGDSYPTAPCGQTLPAGSAPSPACALPGEQCAASSSCKIDEATCGSASTCLPMASNLGTTWDFRVRRLAVQGPRSLSSAFVQNALFDRNVDLKAPQCGETGNGGLNWLMRFDGVAATLTTGGAPPSNDPFHTGYCFARGTGAGVTVAPQTICTSAASGSLQSGMIPALTLPIYLNGDVENALLLPLHAVQLSRVQLSPDHTCIGAFNRNALDAQCTSDPSVCEGWHTAGAVAGYITLEEADTVPVNDLSESLCVLITETSKGADNKCVRDASGKITAPGDYCSVTHAPGGCADSFWFGATFAASAVTIDDGSADPHCH